MARTRTPRTATTTSSASDALAAAYRLLAVRSRSEAELEQRLAAREFPPAAVAAALQRCREFGYLDDSRFALERARALLREGRAVGWRLAAELRRHGVAAELAERAAAEAMQETDLEALLQQLLTRRFPRFDIRRAAPREQRRLVDFFLRRGFARAQVLDYLHSREVDEASDDVRE